MEHGGFTFKVDVERALKRLGATTAEAKKAVVRALNKTIVTARATAATKIRTSGFKVGTSTIKKHLRIVRASGADQPIMVAIRSIGSPLPLASFDVRPRPSRSGNGFRRPAGGVFATVLGKQYGGTDFFYARMPSGHIGVFKRDGRPRLPINEQRGPAIPDGLANDAIISASKAAFDARFAGVLEHELEFVVG
jgi:hypothetical protein